LMLGAQSRFCSLTNQNCFGICFQQRLIRMNNVAFRRYDIARLIANVAAAKPVTDRSIVLVHKLNFRSWVCASNMQNEHFKTTKKNYAGRIDRFMEY
ncbi:MAG: hypothetical protein VX019_04380, partial [Pseudomonadota bacterium]|nr:hypothetical protein [Pseudomonadota bacterium]